MIGGHGAGAGSAIGGIAGGCTGPMYGHPPQPESSATAAQTAATLAVTPTRPGRASVLSRESHPTPLCAVIFTIMCGNLRESAAIRTGRPCVPRIREESQVYRGRDRHTEKGKTVKSSCFVPCNHTPTVIQCRKS